MKGSSHLSVSATEWIDTHWLLSSTSSEDAARDQFTVDICQFKPPQENTQMQGILD